MTDKQSCLTVYPFQHEERGRPSLKLTQRREVLTVNMLCGDVFCFMTGIRLSEKHCCAVSPQKDNDSMWLRIHILASHLMAVDIQKTNSSISLLSRREGRKTTWTSHQFIAGPQSKTTTGSSAHSFHQCRLHFAFFSFFTELKFI